MFHKYKQCSASYYTFSFHPLVTISITKIICLLNKYLRPKKRVLAKYYIHNKYKLNNTQVLRRLEEWWTKKKKKTSTCKILCENNMPREKST